MKKSTQEPSVCIYEAIYIGPNLLLANTQGGSPPAPRREMRLPETAVGPVGEDLI